MCSPSSLLPLGPPAAYRWRPSSVATLSFLTSTTTNTASTTTFLAGKHAIITATSRQQTAQSNPVQPPTTIYEEDKSSPPGKARKTTPTSSQPVTTAGRLFLLSCFQHPSTTREPSHLETVHKLGRQGVHGEEGRRTPTHRPVPHHQLAGWLGWTAHPSIPPNTGIPQNTRARLKSPIGVFQLSMTTHMT